MQYDLTEEQRMLQDMVRRLAKEQVEPGAAKRDREGKFDWEMVALLRENGLIGVDFPEAYEGAGAGMLALAITVEELSRVDAACGLVPAVQELGSLPIMLAGSEAQKQEFLPKLASGEQLAAFGLTEPAAGSDVARLRCRAVRDGDSYVINGTKTFISNGGVADIVTLYAITDPGVSAHKGSSVFVVPKGTPGFSVGKKEDKMGIRWSDTVELIFEDCRVPAANLLGQEGEGFRVMMKTLDFSRLGIAAQALGIAAGALDHAVAYAKERETFGRPIIQHQGVGFKLADMAMRTEAARQLLYKTCSLFRGAAQGHEPPQPPLDSPERHVQVPVRRRGHVGGHRGGPGVGGLRLHQGISGGADDAGRQDYPDLRRHQRNHAPGDRQHALGRQPACWQALINAGIGLRHVRSISQAGDPGRWRQPHLETHDQGRSIRPLQFFISLPEENRRWLGNDVTDRKLLEKWARNLNYDRVLPILAEYDGRVVANATLHFHTFGWGRHIAEVRVTITPEFQGRGLGKLLLEELSQLAARHRVKKLLARIVTTQRPVIKAFEKAGFGLATELKNYVKDVHQNGYADIALLVKELSPGTN